MFALINPRLMSLVVTPIHVPEGGAAWMYLIVATIACSVAMILRVRSAERRRC